MYKRQLLKQAGLIEADKQGQFIYYSLNTTVVDEFLKWLVELKQTKKKTKTVNNAKRSFS